MKYFPFPSADFTCLSFLTPSQISEKMKKITYQKGEKLPRNLKGKNVKPYRGTISKNGFIGSNTQQGITINFKMNYQENKYTQIDMFIEMGKTVKGIIMVISSMVLVGIIWSLLIFFFGTEEYDTLLSKNLLSVVPLCLLFTPSILLLIFVFSVGIKGIKKHLFEILKAEEVKE
jgi:hypothetical protein